MGTNEADLRVRELPPFETSMITMSLENYDTVETKRAQPNYISLHCFISFAMYCLISGARSIFLCFLPLLFSLVLFPSPFISLCFYKNPSYRSSIYQIAVNMATLSSPRALSLCLSRLCPQRQQCSIEFGNIDEDRPLGRRDNEGDNAGAEKKTATAESAARAKTAAAQKCRRFPFLLLPHQLLLLLAPAPRQSRAPQSPRAAPVR